MTTNPYANLHSMVDQLESGQVLWADLPAETTEELFRQAWQRSVDASQGQLIARQKLIGFADLAEGLRRTEAHFLAEGKREDYMPSRRDVCIRHGKVARQVATAIEAVLNGGTGAEVAQAIRDGGAAVEPPKKKRRKL